MVKAWFMDESGDDQRLEHHLNPQEFVKENYLKEHGVLYWKINADNYKDENVLNQLKKDRGYNYEDIITISKECLPNYETKIKTFYVEHLHTDEEIRLALDGSGYFDFRDRDDRWVRVLFEKGDLLILPAGIHHRFTMDTKNYIRAMRLFCGEPIWTPYNREKSKLHPMYEEYVQHRDDGSLYVG